MILLLPDGVVKQYRQRSSPDVRGAGIPLPAPSNECEQHLSPVGTVQLTGSPIPRKGGRVVVCDSKTGAVATIGGVWG